LKEGKERKGKERKEKKREGDPENMQKRWELSMKKF
jgi:hypothetical protein